jgi:O-antigen ligase
VVFFLAVAGVMVWIGSDPVITRFETLGHSQSGQNRVSFWRDSLRLISQHPLLGVGLGAFPVAYPSVQTAFLDLRVDHAHCDYLELVSELGLPGGIFLFASILWVLAKTARHYRRAGHHDSFIYLGCVGSIVAILLHSLADFNLYIPANAMVLSVVLGLASSAAENSRESMQINGNCRHSARGSLAEGRFL